MHEIDQLWLRRYCDRIAADYAGTDFICRETATRLLERLELVTLQPERILDLGSGTGLVSKALPAVYPGSQIVALDWSTAMLRAGDIAGAVCADAHRLPFSDDSFDLVVANMLVPGCAAPEQVFAEACRVLKHPGLFLFTSLGPDTLKELRRAWARVDDAPHVHAFADMHNVGDALVQAGFREPVMDVEHLTVTYSDPAKLFADLRAGAATNLLVQRRSSLTAPGRWQAMLAQLEAGRNQEGRLPITLEVVTGQAWTGAPGAGVAMIAGEAAFPLSRLKRQAI